MSHSGYYRFPTVYKDHIVFVCEDDLWKVPSSGGTALRLTANLGDVSYPSISPDGKWIAYIGKEEGDTEVYVIPAEGGVSARITYLGGISRVVGWSQDGRQIIFSSNAHQPFLKMFKLYKVDFEGGSPTEISVGIGHNISYGPNGKQSVLGRNTVDPARWKRYRGGTAGVIWVDAEGDGNFRFCEHPQGNYACPMWIGERIYFVSDHEGVGNIFSMKPDFSDLQRHTEHRDYFARFASTDGENIVYQAGAEIFMLNIATGENTKTEIVFHSPRIQRQRKFVEAAKFLDAYHIHPKGHSVVITTRGKSYAMGNWEGAVKNIWNEDGARYRLTQWFHSGEKFATVADFKGSVALEVQEIAGDQTVDRFDELDTGRILTMKISPNDRFIAFSNHRFELLVLDLENKKLVSVDKSDFDRIEGFNWSPDSAWIAYSLSTTAHTQSIKLHNLAEGKNHRVTQPDFNDVQPCFDPAGKYLYFLSYRDYNPVYDSMYFDLNFPKGMRPYLITLKNETESPFNLKPRTPEDPGLGKWMAKKKRREAGLPVTVEIDLEGIEKRIAQFPVPEGKYTQIHALQNKVLFTWNPVKGSLGKNWQDATPARDGILKSFDLESNKVDVVQDKITDFKVSSKSETLIYRTGFDLRVKPLNNGPNKKAIEHKAKAYNREQGWIDLRRIKVSVDPAKEWQQMYNEIWRLQKEHFWVENMSGVDWNQVYDRYLPLLKKVSTRGEFSDLSWEMQGELGTSHAYEIGGDYRSQPKYFQGILGADLEYDQSEDAYRITHLVQGDAWLSNSSSSFNRLGALVNEGDWIVSVAGQKVDKQTPPQKLLVNLARTEVEVGIRSADSGEFRTVTIKTLSDDMRARYREWVERNRRSVHELTDGRVGYVHVPNMGPEGYSEFHRYYLAEVDRKAMIVDVRFNGGGHVSQLLLEKLSRKRIGYGTQRWGKQPYPYPAHSVLGPILALTNEYAGSDGDIFSHCFKLMGLGKLVGKRTWGGVIGIHPRHRLVDGTVTTQPEFSSWYQDVGWKVENYGTDPDVEVEFKPQDWASGVDPQLQKGIQLIMEELEVDPPRIPDFGPKPDLSLPYSN